VDDTEHWNASATATADLTWCIQQRAVAAAAAVVVLAASVVRPTCQQALPGSHPSSDNITDVQNFNSTSTIVQHIHIYLLIYLFNLKLVQEYTR